PCWRPSGRGRSSRVASHCPPSELVDAVVGLRRVTGEGCYLVRVDLVPRSRREASFHRRNPPRNALALSPSRQPGGSSFRSLAFPPPSTTSSGSRAATRRPTTSATFLRHFFLPSRSSPRTPT